jgi:hypothetical protein
VILLASAKVDNPLVFWGHAVLLTIPANFPAKAVRDRHLGNQSYREVVALPVVPQRVARTKRIVERVWKAIAAGSFYPTPSPMQCPSCPFREPCRGWTG